MIREVLDLETLRRMGPDEAAATLAARRLDGAGDLDEPALQAWLRLDETHVRAWARAQAAVTAFDEAGDDEILAALRQAARGARRPGLARWPALGAIAATVVALLVGLAVLETPRAPGPAPVVAQSEQRPAAEFVTARGERKDYRLADGSRMTLDTDSAVATAFSTERRGLRLVRGRAFFEVAHDAGRPFVVQAAGREVTAIGTRFDVRIDPGRVRILLVEGRVSVGRPDREAAVILSAGEQLEDRDGLPPVISRGDVEESRNWRRGFVTFQDQSLAAAAAEFNRYSHEQLVVRDPAVARMKVTGVFRADDPERFGRVLSQVHPVRVVRRSAGELEIVPAG